LKPTPTRYIFWAVVLACLLTLAHAADRSKELPQRYRHWFNEEVNYIISSQEKKEFLSLTNDAQRDSFIDTFWRIRNPEPGSETNTYKEEHYKRLSYANEHYGSVAVQDGWRTDRGRMYIILGPPKQVMTYLSARNVRPMEIWFYESPSRALPPYFSIIFYKRSAGEEFSLYSPLSDGPVRLASSALEDMNDQKRSLDSIRKSLGDEVARTTVSLIPGEPVDLRSDDYEPSMSSDLLLSEIAGLPDNPLTQEMLNQNRARERVTTSIFVGGQDATISYDSFRDEHGRMTLSYLMLMMFPTPKMVGTRSDGSLYYDVTLRTDIVTTSGKPVYSQEDRMTSDLTTAQAEVARKKRFGAEARLPLVPGTYTLQATLTNNVDQVATRQRATVTVPQPNSENIGISGVLAYAAPAGVPDPRNEMPFSGSHFRFTPRGAQNVYIRQGEKLPLAFQLWLDPKTIAIGNTSEKIKMHYVFGSIGALHSDPTREDEELDAANRDEAGNLLSGHTIDTSELAPGNYQIAVSATRDGDQKTAYATLSLHIAPATEYVETWTAYGPAEPGGAAADDVKRGLAAEAQGANTEAQTAYRRAIVAGPSDMQTLDLLTALLQRQNMTDQLVELSRTPILEKSAANPATLLVLAQALNKNGNPKAIVHLLETQIALQPPSVDLYTTLADACIATGNKVRAVELRGLAAKVKE
jgi:GWxTD domain-containing protein